MDVTIDLREKARPHAPPLCVVPELAPAARATWLGRMVNEFMSAEVFEALARQMADAGFEDADVKECRRFADEERSHGVLCGAVVEALGGRAYAVAPERRPLPEHGRVSRREAVLQNLLSVSCLSETVAVSLIAAERIEMPEGPLRDLLTRIWSDEIGHARFGWRILAAVVPSLDDAGRARLGAYLAVALAHLEEHELAHLPEASCPPPGGAALGLCNGRDARVLFYETVDQVIVPRLEALGIEARAAWNMRNCA
jgi:hypothetical protein